MIRSSNRSRHPRRNPDGAPYCWFYAHVEAVRCHERGFEVVYRRPGVTVPLTAYVDGATAGGHIRVGRMVMLRVHNQRIVDVAL